MDILGLDKGKRLRRQPGTPPKSKLSLNLHTMPQTSTGHFKKWLVLALLVFGLFVIIALLVFA